MYIAIIDYGAGNLRSVEKAIEALGFKAILTKDKEEIRKASGIILPGVGSFDSAMQDLRANHLESVIEEIIALNRPFLGICLGYQLLFEKSEEGKLNGLNIIKGQVKKFNFKNTPFDNLSIPHMGWNRLIINHPSGIFDGIATGSMVYFAHSYFPEPVDKMIISTKTDYGIEFASSISKDNIFGIQFHPEKSGEVGLAILRNFIKICSK